MKNKKVIYAVIVIFVLVIVFGCMVINNGINETKMASSQILFNKKIGWGIKRNDNHEQPDLGKSNKELLEKYNGIAMGNKEDKYIYLTFDEGYEAGYTNTILDVLKENNVKATFFITAHYINTASEIVQRMIDEGHIVGNHTVNHKSMPTLSKEEIEKEIMDLHKSIYNKYGYEMKYIRPPMGEFSDGVLEVINSLEYKTVMWSFAYEDWNEDKQPDEKLSLEKISNYFHNGEIMLLHGNSKTNTNILDSIIKKAKEMGYEFKSLDEFQK